MSTDRLKEKIQKLLQMTTENGCTEYEAARALALAQKLLAENNLSMSSISSEEDKVDCFKVEFETKGKSQTQTIIGLALAKHFGVIFAETKTDCYVIGEKSRADVFIECYKFTYKVFLKEWNNHLKSVDKFLPRGEKIAIRNLYLLGFVNGFQYVLSAQEKTYALALSVSVKTHDYVKSNCETKTRKRHMKTSDDIRHYTEGIRDGKTSATDKYGDKFIK